MAIRDSVRAAALAAALAPAVLLAAPQWRAEVAVAGYGGAAPLTNFPVLVRVSEAAIPGFRYAACRKNTLCDVQKEIVDLQRTCFLAGH